MIEVKDGSAFGGCTACGRRGAAALMIRLIIRRDGGGQENITTFCHTCAKSVRGILQYKISTLNVPDSAYRSPPKYTRSGGDPVAGGLI